MTKTFVAAALAITAFATLSIAASGDAFARGGGGGGAGGHGMGGGGMGMHSGSMSMHTGGSKVLGGNRFIGGNKFLGRSKFVRHEFRHRRFYGWGYGYDSCWRWTPDGLVNVCVD